MSIPYRTRRLLKNLGIIALVAILVSALVWTCWFIWLDRYVVYTRDDGAVLDFDRGPEIGVGQPAVPPEPAETVPIYYNEGENQINTSKELTQIAGYYIERQALTQDIDAVIDQLRMLPAGTAVMVDVKNIKGEFYYSSTVSGQRSSSVKAEDMDELIAYLNKSSLYTIARLPAFRDYHFGLKNVPFGLYHTSRQYLWMDGEGCYWLNPSSEGTLSYLVQIVGELRDLGFDEVVFSDFCFPDTENILFSGDQHDALMSAADTLATICASETFCVSFCSETTDFELPTEERCRLYLVNFTAAQVRTAAQATGLESPEIRVVFITEHGDTRFDEFSVMRPVSLIRHEDN